MAGQASAGSVAPTKAFECEPFAKMAEKVLVQWKHATTADVTNRVKTLRTLAADPTASDAALDAAAAALYTAVEDGHTAEDDLAAATAAIDMATQAMAGWKHVMGDAQGNVEAQLLQLRTLVTRASLGTATSNTTAAVEAATGQLKLAVMEAHTRELQQTIAAGEAELDEPHPDEAADPTLQATLAEAARVLRVRRETEGAIARAGMQCQIAEKYLTAWTHVDDAAKAHVRQLLVTLRSAEGGGVASKDDVERTTDALENAVMEGHVSECQLANTHKAEGLERRHQPASVEDGAQTSATTARAAMQCQIAEQRQLDWKHVSAVEKANVQALRQFLHCRLANPNAPTADITGASDALQSAVLACHAAECVAAHATDGATSARHCASAQCQIANKFLKLWKHVTGDEKAAVRTQLETLRSLVGNPSPSVTAEVERAAETLQQAVVQGHVWECQRASNATKADTPPAGAVSQSQSVDATGGSTWREIRLPAAGGPGSVLFRAGHRVIAAPRYFAQAMADGVVVYAVSPKAGAVPLAVYAIGDALTFVPPVGPPC